jgi:2-phosphoglycerate kinase
MHDAKTNNNKISKRYRLAHKKSIMKNIVIVGGSKGIGSAILLQQLDNFIYNISRNAPDIPILT